MHSEDEHLVADRQTTVENASPAAEVQLQQEQQLESCERMASSGTAVQFLSLQQLLQQHIPISYCTLLTVKIKLNQSIRYSE